MRRTAARLKGAMMAGKDFEELDLYRVARELRKLVWQLARQLPPDERFVLASQMRRAALSATNNIAEGHGTYTFRHNVAYLHRTRGSLYELRDDLNACEDAGYVQPPQAEQLRAMMIRTIQLTDGYIRYLRSRQAPPPT